MRALLLAVTFLAMVGAGLAAMAGWKDGPLAVQMCFLTFVGSVLAGGRE